MGSGIGATGFILLVIVALLLFGPKKLPELGRALGRTMREFKSGARELLDDDDRKDKSASEVQSIDNSEKNNKRLPD